MAKKLLNSILFILSPVVLVSLFTFPANIFSDGIYSNTLLLIVLYALSLAGMVLFYRFAHSHLWALPVGFALTSAVFFIDSAIFYSGMMFQYIGAALYSLVYSLPFFVLSAIIMVVLLLKKRKRAK